jgi:MFS family permease
MVRERIDRDTRIGEARLSYYGWVVVLAAFVLSILGFGGLVTVAVFLKPLTQEYGWLRGDVSAAYAVGSASTALGGLVFGHLADRYALKPIAVLGAVGLATGLFLLAWTDSLWQLYVSYFILGGFGLAAHVAPLSAGVSHWFFKYRGLAIGIVTAGGAVGQGVVPYIARAMLSAFGWQSALLYLAIGYVLLGVPMACLIRHAGGSEGDGAQARVALHHPTGQDPAIAPGLAIAWIAGAALFCCICMAVPITHVVALVSDKGIAPQTAAGVLTLVMLAAAIGRICAGHLGDTIGGLRIYLLMSFGQTVVVFWVVLIDDLVGLYLWAAIFGLLFGGVMTSIFVTLRQLVPPSSAALAMAIAGVTGWGGMALGAYQGGLLFDLTGTYTWSYANAVFAGAINVSILMALYVFLARQRGHAVMTLS